jgi:hypothetical protein
MTAQTLSGIRGTSACTAAIALKRQQKENINKKQKKKLTHYWVGPAT